MSNAFIYFFITPFFVINISSFYLMGNDKKRSQKEGAERTPEGLIFFWSLLGGALGVYLGMLAFRHKTKKWYFRVGIPLALIQNISLFVLTYYLLNN